MKFDIIILAGGKGTRLKSLVTDIPKPMAPIRNRPFLEYILSSIPSFLINSFVFSVGYKKNVIIDHFGDNFENIPIHYAEESVPLGTGGGLKLSLNKCSSNNVIVINGDTFFNIDYKYCINTYLSSSSDVSICLKKIENSSRYGSVLLDKNERIIKFEEKKYIPEGNINGGIYFLRKKIEKFLPEGKFSFENDFLEKKLNDFLIKGILCDNYFIDIGIPHDYLKAQKTLNPT